MSDPLTQPPAAKPRRARFWRFLGHVGFLLIAAASIAWTATALSVQFSGTLRNVLWAFLALAAAATLYARFWKSRRAGWGTLALTAAATGIWYQSLYPSNDRNWAADVAHGVQTSLNGDIATLTNVRAFRWKDDATADQNWVTHSYDLSKLDSLDMITSVWDSPDIAHLLVSFGFSDGQHVVFSVEIRKESHEKFSTIGGFFREFEMVLIAADEEDIVKLRTNYRKEDVHLYPIKLDQARMRTMFMAYANLGNDLAARPAFYNTITSNCTTAVYRMAKLIKPDMPLDIRLIKSGRLPEYLDDLGAFKGKMPIETRRQISAITDIAQGSKPTDDFSALIRSRITLASTTP